MKMTWEKVTFSFECDKCDTRIDGITIAQLYSGWPICHRCYCEMELDDLCNIKETQNNVT
jgi:hypothetical protein